MRKKIISLVALVAISLSFSGCKKWLDVNTNPNIAGNPDIALVLPSAELAIANVLGNVFQINGAFWSQHWTQSPLANQYKIYDQYQVSSDNYNRPWRNMYNNALTDLKYIYGKAKEGNKTQYMAISRILSAYTYQVLTDAFGDIPFSESLKGSVADGALVSPKYDKQEDVYKGIIVMLNEAQGLIDADDAGHPGADDLIFGGDMALWNEFANTLKLRVYMRLSAVDPTTAEAGIKALTGDFLSKSAKIQYFNKGGNENPLYSEMVGLSRTTNIFASKTSVDPMNAYGDPRAYVVYTPIASGAVVGLLQGDFNNSTAAAGKSLGGYGVGANPLANDAERNAVAAAAPVYLMSKSESDFLQAEAIARGWMTTGDDAVLFKSGVLASMADHSTEIQHAIDEEYLDLTAYGNNDADLGDYLDSMFFYTPELDYSGTLDQKVEKIITQKWVSMNGTQGFEAWTEWRRTGYPALVPSVNSLIGAGNFPQRFIYPTDEVNLNPNVPGGLDIKTKVWWDKN